MAHLSPSEVLRRYREVLTHDGDLYPCEHGHFDCSTSTEGPCSNEAEAAYFEEFGWGPPGPDRERFGTE